jgi:hypothetical protein
VLDLINETLHQVAFLVEMLIVLALLDPISTGRDDAGRAALRNARKKGILIIGFVGNHELRFVCAQQLRRLRAIMPLPARQTKVKRVAQGIDDDVNLGAEAAATTA